jgi:hypothetical protein
MASSGEIYRLFENLAKAKSELLSVRSSLTENQQAALESVPFRFLEWTIRRLGHLERIFGEAPTSPCPEAAALYARLLLETLGTLRWISRSPERAREFARAGFADMAEVNQRSIEQLAAKDTELKDGAITVQRGLAQAAAAHRIDLKRAERWPIGSDLLERKLRADGLISEDDKLDWASVYSLSVFLHPTPYFVIADEKISTFEQVFASCECAARIALDITALLAEIYREK